jgi:hypothetical protein
VTKTEQRKIASRHLFNWFGRPITVKENDVDALWEMRTSNVDTAIARFCLD